MDTIELLKRIKLLAARLLGEGLAEKSFSVDYYKKNLLDLTKRIEERYKDLLTEPEDRSRFTSAIEHIAQFIGPQKKTNEMILRYESKKKELNKDEQDSYLAEVGTHVSKMVKALKNFILETNTEEFPVVTYLHTTELLRDARFAASLLLSKYLDQGSILTMDLLNSINIKFRNKLLPLLNRINEFSNLSARTKISIPVDYRIALIGTSNLTLEIHRALDLTKALAIQYEEIKKEIEDEVFDEQERQEEIKVLNDELSLKNLQNLRNLQIALTAFTFSTQSKEFF